MNHMKRSTSRIRGDIDFLVQVAQSDPNEAKKIFGIDRMTAEQRKAALHRTTLVGFLPLLKKGAHCRLGSRSDH